MMESSMKSISRPVIDRLPVGQLDEFACRQLDRVCALSLYINTMRFHELSQPAGYPSAATGSSKGSCRSASSSCSHLIHRASSAVLVDRIRPSLRSTACS